MANNPNAADNLTAPRFQPGQSGNPGGISAEHRALLNANAEKASRIRGEFLDYVLSLMEPDEEGERKVPINADTLRLIKDSEDRGLGAPKQTTELEGNVGITGITRRIVRPSDRDGGGI